MKIQLRLRCLLKSFLSWIFWASITGMLIVVASLIFFVCFCNTKAYNFGVVNEGQIYRSAQPDEEFLNQLFEDYKIKTIIVLNKVPRFESKMAHAKGIKIVYLPLSASKEPPRDFVKEFLETVKNSNNYPILVHCQGGADRTGLMIAIKRIELDGWTLEAAKKEMLYYRNIPLFRSMPRQFLEKWHKAER